MSDDEYYADSPYDEFEEMLWDADPAPNLADDLAQHAAYSPVWQDDPAGELEVYHSDWEYYSDDYFDDDPAILKKYPMDGNSPRAKNTARVTAGRGKKRKINDIDEIDKVHEPVEIRALKSSIRGTVWAKQTSATTAVFQNGQQEKVALLIDWQKHLQPRRRKEKSEGNTQLRRDESWANDLSLADMGLMHVRDRAGSQQDIRPDNSEADEFEMDEDGEDDIDDDDENIDHDKDVVTLNGSHPDGIGALDNLYTQNELPNNYLDTAPKNASRLRESMTQHVESDYMQNTIEKSPSANKRAKTASTTYPSPLQTTRSTTCKSKRSEQDTLSETQIENDTELDGSRTIGDVSTQSLETDVKVKDTTRGESKKRKLSLSTDEDSPSVATKRAGHAKRTASDRLKDRPIDIPQAEPRTRNLGSTKSRKKKS